MNKQEKQAYLKTKAEERKKIQQQINRLNEQRKKYVAKEMKNRVDKGEDTLEKVITKTVREQAIKKNFTFDSSGISIKK